MWGNPKQAHSVSREKTISNKIFFSVKPHPPKKSIAKNYTKNLARKGSKAAIKKSIAAPVSDLSSTTQNGLKILNLPLSYPGDAVRKKLTGIVIVKVSFENSGKIKTKEIIQSSGHQILDRTVLIALDKGELKDSTGQAPDSMTLSFNFTL